MRILSAVGATLLVVALAGCSAGAATGDPLTKADACKEVQQWAKSHPSPDLDPGSSESMQTTSDYFLSVATEFSTLSDRVKDKDPLFAGILADAAAPNNAAAQAASKLAAGDTDQFSDLTQALTESTSKITDITTACQ